MKQVLIATLPLVAVGLRAQQLAAAPASPPATARAQLSQSEVRRLADEIDRLVDAGLGKAGVRPNSAVDDAAFLRRAWLTIAGRIPSLEEAERYFAHRGRDRRHDLVDELVASPGRDSSEFNWWAELLRVRTRLMRQTSGEPFMHWLKQSIADDKPYDDMVREMLTAAGPAHQRGNGATGWLMRDLGMPEDSMANTMRTFLGTRLECAQCHNHPFDRWTRREFYEMVAFGGGLRYDTGYLQSAPGQRLREIGAKLMQEHGRQAQQALRRLILPATVGISGSGTGLARLPDNYQYDDASPRQPVAARAVFGPVAALEVQVPQQPARGRRDRAPRLRRDRGNSIPGAKEVDSRQAFADWVVSPDNPRFATVIANRMWKKIMGVGLIEPVDDLRDDTQASNPELMQRLSALVVELGYDLRQLQRVLLHTRLFQREAVSERPDGADFAFAGPLMRRMSAEQMWDSLVTLMMPDPDGQLLPPGARAEDTYEQLERLEQLPDGELEQRLEELVLAYKDPELRRELVQKRNAERAQRRRDAMAAQVEQARPLYQQLQQARRRSDQRKVAEIEGKLAAMGVPIPGQRRPRRAGELRRASDLPQPAPQGHLLREFGQSDREQPDASHREASVPQVLMLLNGFVDSGILGDPGAYLRAEIGQRKSVPDKIEAAFLALLARRPTAAEARDWAHALAEAGDGKALEAGLRDLVWVLINSHEFRFVR